MKLSCHLGLATMSLYASCAFAAGGGPPFQLEWGSFGTGPGQFNQPTDIAISSAGDVYVTDTQNNRVEQFNLTGGFVREWGTPGVGDGQFSQPTGVGLDAAGRVYVVDALNLRIEKFTSDGTFISSFGRTGGPLLHQPMGIAIGPTGDAYVVNSGDNTILEYAPDGSFVRSWGGFGAGAGQFESPKCLAIGADSIISVADFLNSRVERFTPDGISLPGFSLLVVAGEFGDPWGIAVTPAGDIYCSLQGNDKIREYNGTGGVLATWGGVGSTPGLFLAPTAIALDAAGDVFIVDQANNRIQRFGTSALAVGGGPGLPRAGALRAYPDPARANVRFAWVGMARGAATLTVVDASGRLVRRFRDVNDDFLEWDGRDDLGRETRSGVYFAQLRVADSRSVRRIVRLP